MAPAMNSGAQLRTLRRRVKVWRSKRARELVTRILGEADAMKAGAATQHQCLPVQRGIRFLRKAHLHAALFSVISSLARAVED